MWLPRLNAPAFQANAAIDADSDPSLHRDRDKGEAGQAKPASALRRTLTYFMSGALGGFCSVALTLLLLRLLGGEGYKSVGLALSASMFVIALTFEWLRFYALRFSAEPSRLGPIYSLYALAAAVLLCTTGVMAVLGVTGQIEEFALIVVAVAIVQAVCDLLIVVARSASNSPMLVVMQVGRGVIALAACGVTAAATGDAHATLITYVAAYAGVSALAVTIFRRSMPRATLPSTSDALTILRFGGPLMASALINSLLLMSDRWIITLAGRFPDAAVGGYIGLSDICIRGLTFFAGVLVAAFLQDIIAAFDRGEAGQAGAHYSLMTAAFAAVVAPIAIGAVVFGPEAAALFARTSALLPPALFTSIVVAVIAHISRNALIETLLLLEKRTLLVLAINVGAFALALALSFALTPIWAMAGVPIAFTIASISAGIAGLAVMRPQTRALLALDETARVIAAAMAAGLLCLYLPPSLPIWARFASFAVAYAFFLAPLLRQRLRARPSAPLSAGVGS